jgi:hypothetical protein
MKCVRILILTIVAFVEEQANTLKRSAYGFIMIPDKPGSFYLVFKHPTNSRKHEYVNIKPTGYLFRKKMFPKIEDLLDYFKTSEAEKSRINVQGSQMRKQDTRPIDNNRPVRNNQPIVSQRSMAPQPRFNSQAMPQTQRGKNQQRY